MKATFSRMVLIASLALAGTQSVTNAQAAPQSTQPTTTAAAQATLTDSTASTNSTYFEPTSQASNSLDSCCSSICADGGLLGMGVVKRSDHAFSRFISPMTNPIFFEDPRNNTEARAIFFDHKVPLAAGSGSVNLYALQLRARLSENVSLIATKDGYIKSSNPLINNGWADLAAGLKFTLLRDVASQRLLSGGFTFELPTGEADPLQGNGDGMLNMFLTGGRQVGCHSHWISAFGWRLPMNATDESQSIYWSNHFDYEIRRGLYFLTEANWYHWTRSGQDGAIPGIEGLDAFNLGSPGVAGNDIVTGAVGLKMKPNVHNEIGVAFEVPLTEREDIIDNRLTVDWIFRY